MLEVCARLICALIMTIFGIFVIEKITNREIKVLSPKTIIQIIVLCLATIFISKKEYAGIGTIAIFALQIIVYKEMFYIKTNSLNWILIYIKQYSSRNIWHDYIESKAYSPSVTKFLQ